MQECSFEDWILKNRVNIDYVNFLKINGMTNEEIKGKIEELAFSAKISHNRASEELAKSVFNKITVLMN